MMKSTWVWKQDHVAHQEDETSWKYRQIDFQMKQLEDVECLVEDGAEWSDNQSQYAWCAHGRHHCEQSGWHSDYHNREEN
jgi:hypothetical protein